MGMLQANRSYGCEDCVSVSKHGRTAAWVMLEITLLLHRTVCLALLMLFK